MKHVPTTWGETIFIDGYPVDYSVIARRHKQQWYIARINATEEPKRVSISLVELQGSNFSIIKDKRNGESVKEEIKRVEGKFEVIIQPQGGFVITN